MNNRSADPIIIPDARFVRAISEKAIRVAVSGREVVLPKSQILPQSQVKANGGSGRLVIPEWLAEEKGLTRQRPPADPPSWSWKRGDWLVVDVETTGLVPEEHRVIELALVAVSDRRIVSVDSWLLDPECEVSPEITKITGIRPEDLQGQPRFADIAGTVAARLRSASHLVAYNAPFDSNFVEHELDRAGVSVLLTERTWIDPLVWIKEVDKFERGKKLTEACARRRIAVDGDAHRAGADAQLAAKLLAAILHKLPDGIDELRIKQERMRWDQEQDRARYQARKGGGR